MYIVEYIHRTIIHVRYSSCLVRMSIKRQTNASREFIQLTRFYVFLDN